MAGQGRCPMNTVLVYGTLCGYGLKSSAGNGDRESALLVDTVYYVAYWVETQPWEPLLREMTLVNTLQAMDREGIINEYSSHF